MRVFIVEDSETTRNDLLNMLSDISGVEFSGHAVDEAGAIEGIDSLLPDIVTLDLHLRQGSGINVLAYIKKHHAAIRVIVLSNFVGEPYVSLCRQADYFFNKSFQFMFVGAAIEQLIDPDVKKVTFQQ